VPLGDNGFPALTLDEDSYFIMGDHRTRSADLRLYGPVPLMSMAGRASAVIWPPRRDGHTNWRLLHLPAAFAALTPRR
jgi:signal peptidase I